MINNDIIWSNNLNFIPHITKSLIRSRWACQSAGFFSIKLNETTALIRSSFNFCPCLLMKFFPESILDQRCSIQSLRTCHLVKQVLMTFFGMVVDAFSCHKVNALSSISVLQDDSATTRYCMAASRTMLCIDRKVFVSLVSYQQA